jgi:hypothetical protein
VDFGLDFQVLTEEVLKKYQQFQNYALRYLFSVGNKTSIAALHVLSRVESMKERNYELNARWIAALLTKKEHHPAGKLYSWLCNNNIGYCNNSCLPDEVRNKNPISLVDVDENEYDNLFRERRKEELLEWQSRGGSVVRALPKVENMQIPYSLQLAGLWSREEMNIIIKWKLGRLASHQRCIKCNNTTTVSRHHFWECSQKEIQLRSYCEEKGIHVDDGNNTQLFIDQLLEEIDNIWDETIYVNGMKFIAKTISEAAELIIGWKKSTRETFEEDDDPNDAINIKLKRVYSKGRKKKKA